MNTKVEFYRDHRGDHRWRIIIHLTTSRTIQPEPDYAALAGGIAEGVHDDEDGAA